MNYYLVFKKSYILPLKFWDFSWFLYLALFLKVNMYSLKNETGMGEGCILFTSFHMYLDKNFK